MSLDQERPEDQQQQAQNDGGGCRSHASDDSGGMTSVDRRSLVFVTRADCPLCEKGAALVRRYAPRFGVAVEMVDVATSPALLEEFGERVPVLLAVGHKVLAEGKLTAFAVQAALLRVRLGL